MGKSKRACGGHANHKIRVEMKNLIKLCWLAGARSSTQAGGRAAEGLSGAAHLQKPLRSVYVCGVTLCFLCPGPGLGLRSKTGIGFRQRAVGGRLQLTRDDLVRCERALSNLQGNKLEVIFYEASVPGCLKALSPSRCALSAQLMCL